MDDECIAVLRALDIERAGLRVAGWRYLTARRILPPRIYGGGHDGIAVRDPQHRLVGSHSRIVAFRLEMMCRHAVLLLASDPSSEERCLCLDSPQNWGVGGAHFQT